MDSCLYVDFQRRKDLLEYHRLLDSKNSNKKAFAAVRGPGHPPVTETKALLQFDAIVAPTDQTLDFDLYADSAVLERVDLSSSLLVGGCVCSPLRFDGFSLAIQSASALPVDGQSVHVAQQQYHFSPSAVASDLNGFWQPVWQRDPLDLSLPFPLLQTFSREPEIQVDMLDIDQWMLAIRQLKPGSARGIDSISSQELKLLPRSLISVLAKLLHDSPGGFPRDFMVGLTCPLAKTASLPTNADTRPITVLAQLYRLWSSVACRQIATWFSLRLPKEITGLLPHRGSSDTAFQTQFDIERARHQQRPKSGLTLDLKKCFNNLKWSFVYALLWLLGVPVVVLHQWILSISCLQRVWLVSGQVFDAGCATTGMPEGDVFSVMCMLAVNTFWIRHVRAACVLAGFSPGSLALSAYADNWAWSTDVVALHRPIMVSTQSFVVAAGLSIDLSKTWFWSTPVSDEHAVRGVLSPVLPGVHLQYKSSSADLGFQLQYSGHFRLGINQERVDKGLLRLRRLQALPHDVATKAKLIKISVYPPTCC